MRTSQSGVRYAFIVLGIIVLAMLVINFNNRMTELRRLTADREAVKEQLSSQLRTQVALATEIAYATSEAAVEDWAYAEGHRMKSGDTAIVPVEPATSRPAPTIAPAEEEPAPANWKRWWELFFGVE